MPTIDEIDATWILENMARRNSAETGITTNIHVWLSTSVQTASGPATVTRDVYLTPQEVLSVLRARAKAPSR